MQESLKKHLARVFILLIGLTIAHLGVTLFLIADLGADPFNVLIQGLFRLEQRLIGSDLITHGRIHMMVSFLIIIVLLITDKSYVRIGTLICMFLGGPIIDVFNFILNPILVPILNMPVRLVLNVRLRNSCLWHDHRH